MEMDPIIYMHSARLLLHHTLLASVARFTSKASVVVVDNLC